MVEISVDKKSNKKTADSVTKFSVTDHYYKYHGIRLEFINKSPDNLSV